MIQVNRIYLIFNRLVTKKFLVDTSVFRIINDDAKIGSIRHMPCRQIPGIYTQITDYAFPPATKSWSYKAKTPAIV